MAPRVGKFIGAVGVMGEVAQANPSRDGVRPALHKAFTQSTTEDKDMNTTKDDDELDNLKPAHFRGSLMVKNLRPGLPEIGKIKIGKKGEVRKSNKGKEFQLPQKLDYFIVTTMERDSTGNFKPDEDLHKALGDQPRELPVRLLFNDIEMNFQSRYAQYNGRVLACSGDGEKAYRQAQNGTMTECPCPCPKSSPEYKGVDKCKINGNLAVVIDNAPVIGGVWKFRTTSYNSVVGIMSSMVLIRQITGGLLANIPLTLKVTPKSVSDPDGRAQTVYVVGLEYKGSSDQLQQIGYDAALRNVTHHVKIDHIEEQAKILLLPSSGGVFDNETADDVVEEFYPDQAVKECEIPARPKPEDFQEPATEQRCEEGAADHEAKEPAQTKERLSAFPLLDEYGTKLNEYQFDAEFIAALGGVLERSSNPNDVWENNKHVFEAIDADMTDRNIPRGIQECAKLAAMAKRLIDGDGTVASGSGSIPLIDEYGEHAGDYSPGDYVAESVKRINEFDMGARLEAFWDFNADGREMLGVRTEASETVAGAYNEMRAALAASTDAEQDAGTETQEQGSEQ